MNSVFPFKKLGQLDYFLALITPLSDGSLVLTQKYIHDLLHPV